IDSGHRDFAGRDRTDALDKVRVVCCAESDVMGEQCRADHVVMAVDRIRAPDDRYGGGAWGAIYRRVVEAIGDGVPSRNGGVFVVAVEWPAPVENRPLAIHA